MSVKKAHSITSNTPATSPVSLIAKGMPTIPAPMMALTRLLVAPATEDLCSFVSVDSFLTSLEEPPGVETETSLRGVEGAKNGEAICFSFFVLGAMVQLRRVRKTGWRASVPTVGTGIIKVRNYCSLAYTFNILTGLTFTTTWGDGYSSAKSFSILRMTTVTR